MKSRVLIENIVLIKNIGLNLQDDNGTVINCIRTASNWFIILQKNRYILFNITVLHAVKCTKRDELVVEKH